MAHECNHEQTIGRFKEFMEATKGIKATLLIMSLTIAIQVGTFMYLWGGLTETVKRHDITIEKVCSTLDGIRLVGYAVAEEMTHG